MAFCSLVSLTSYSSRLKFSRILSRIECPTLNDHRLRSIIFLDRMIIEDPIASLLSLNKQGYRSKRFEWKIFNSLSNFVVWIESPRFVSFINSSFFEKDWQMIFKKTSKFAPIYFLFYLGHFISYVKYWDDNDEFISFVVAILRR